MNNNTFFEFLDFFGKKTLPVIFSLCGIVNYLVNRLFDFTLIEKKRLI